LATPRRAKTVARTESPNPAPLAFTLPAPTPTLMPRSAKARDEGPNPFLIGEGGKPGYLEQSYNEGTAYQVTVPGQFVEKEAHNRQGEATGTKVVVTGDAEKVIFFLRQAANLLDIGVRIVTEPAKAKGMVTVKYLGQTRKAARGTGGRARDKALHDRAQEAAMVEIPE
jgi:hypothetical protein